MTPRFYRCLRCGYHYPPNEVVRFRAYNAQRHDHYVCIDEERCRSNVLRREVDRKAVGR